ncbi:lysophospholipid acyltransferase family protein [Ensifer soli]|uniref:lysophospholipid acyltransferase family protein n=1 Tax=Ciceribacter sp. sgz301302 TaxID=3342379 RepID=UPI0035B7B396
MILVLRACLTGAALLVWTLLLLPFQLVFLRFNLKARRLLPRWWHRLACVFLGIRVHMHGVPDPRRPLLIAANHVAWIDIIVLGAILDVVFIAKSEVRDWPVFGILARLQASIFIEREQRRATGAQVNEIGRRLADGEVVVLFPEGTTSDGNRLLEVKTSLFGAAAAAVPLSPAGVVHVQPVAIAYTRVHGMAMGRYHRPLAGWPGDVPLVPHLMGLLRTGAIDVDVSFGEAVDCRAETKRKDLSQTVAARIRMMLLRMLRGGW